MKYQEEKGSMYYDKEEKEKIINRFKNASGRKPVTSRIDQKDLESLRILSEREGMPYQTLLGSIVHKYVTGKLVDVGEVKKILK